MTRTLLLAAMLGLGAATVQAQSTSQDTFQGIQGEQVPPAPEFGIAELPETPGLSFKIGKPSALELSQENAYSPVEQTRPFFRSSVVTRHRVRNNGTTGLDIFDRILN